MKTIEASVIDIATIQDIARKTWPVAFDGILSHDQIEYMLEWMYNREKLTEAISIEKQQFFLELNAYDKPIGFAGVQFPIESNVAKLHKIYLLPSYHGIGAGAHLLRNVMHWSKSQGARKLRLNVNRFNKAKQFYEKFGFQVIQEEDIEIGNGFLMEDFVMEVDLTNCGPCEPFRWS